MAACSIERESKGRVAMVTHMFHHLAATLHLSLAYSGLVVRSFFFRSRYLSYRIYYCYYYYYINNYKLVVIGSIVLVRAQGPCRQINSIFFSSSSSSFLLFNRLHLLLVLVLVHVLLYPLYVQWLSLSVTSQLTTRSNAE